MIDSKAAYRAIPSVQELIQLPVFQAFEIAPRYVKTIIQTEIVAIRGRIAAGKIETNAVLPALQRAILRQLQKLTRPGLKRVVNATGIVLHTNMGRAPLSAAAKTAIAGAVEHYSNLEIDLKTGKRGNRMAHVESLICLVTGAEAALVVNNCAAAIFLTLNSLCRRKEVVVSRGELVEIGGSFRMPDVMKSSGAKMVEVGTTNKTHLKDYQSVISSKTGALLKVHTSNYRVLGFTKSVPVKELSALANERDMPLLYDMGSGVLEDLQQWGLAREPLASEMIDAGVDVITFSGDKLLGGPQAGIIAGKRKYLQKIRKNHLARALRCDKLVLSALEATLRLYLQPEKLPETLPAAQLLTMPVTTLRERAETVKRAVKNPRLNIEIIETFSQVGSGALPLEKLPSMALRVTSPRFSSKKLAEKLREYSPPIVGYVQDGALLLNLRTVCDDEVELILVALEGLK